jgi:lysophospholipase L1-like esterase
VKINHMLAEKYRDQPGVTFLDVTSVFMRDGKLDTGLFLDPHLTPPDPPLHPSAQGQTLLARAMEPTLARLLGDRPH